MRGWLGLCGALLLAGCGDGEDFTIGVSMAPGAAQAELGRLDGGSLMQMSSLPRVQTRSNGSELIYIIPGDGEDGEVRMRFDEAGAKQTRIAVTVSLPERIVQSGSKQMVIDERKVELELRRAMAEWAKELRTSGYASLEPIDKVIGSVALVLNIDSDDETEIAGLFAPEDMGGPEGFAEPEFAAADSDFDPMLDSGEDAADASLPMDDASGEDPGDDWGSEGY